MQTNFEMMLRRIKNRQQVLPVFYVSELDIADILAVVKSDDAHEYRIQEHQADAEAGRLAEGMSKVDLKLYRHIDVVQLINNNRM